MEEKTASASQRERKNRGEGYIFLPARDFFAAWKTFL